MTQKARLSIVVLLVLTFFQSTAQVSFDNRADLEKAASEFFESGDYAKAKPLYSQLLSLSALDPNYNYRFGVCVLYTEADPMKPLPYIEGGANTSGVNPEAYYFLGKAYQLNYRFDEAITYLEKAKKAGLADKIDGLERSIQECRNGLILYNADVEFDPAQDKEVLEAEFYRPYDFRKLRGKVIPLPPNFKTKYDQKNLQGTFVYAPMNSQSLFYASYGDDGKNAKDIYRVNRLPNGEWGLPIRLPNEVNTKYDEDFAFFDDEASVLYFASKGHNTMGGYDIFRTEYNAEKNEWTVPRNLQHPINSPYDDFLYISDPKGRVAYFTSKRKTELGQIRVFKTLLFDPELVEISVVEGQYDDKTDSVYNYMMATVIDPATNEVVGKYRSNKETGKYLLILPPQNGYTMNVGPKESMGFKLKFDLPQNESDKPLQQEVLYDTVNGEGNVTLVNYFNSTGAKDSVVELATRNKAEVEKEMVEMPDPTEILAAQQARIDVKQKEEKARLEQLAAEEDLRFAREKAKKDSLLAVKQLALEQEAARLKREAKIRDSIAKSKQAALLAEQKEQAIADSIAKAEEVRLAQEREKAIADSIAKAEELALQEQKKAAAIADSIAKAEEARLAQEREKAIADSIAQAEELALQEQEQAAAAADSIAKAEEARLAQEREKAIADSIAKVEELALQEQKKAAAIADSIAKAEEVRLTQEREKATADSIAKVEELALQEQKKAAAVADSIAKAEEARLAQEREKAIADSIAKVEELALQEQKKATAIADSIAKAEEVRLAQEREKAIADSIAKVEELALQEQKKATAIADSITKAEEVPLAQEREKAIADSIAKVEELALQEQKKATAIADSIAKAEEARLAQEREKAIADSIAEVERMAAIDAEVEAAKRKALQDSAIVVADEGDSQSVDDVNTYQGILAEMARKEAELLEQKAREDSLKRAEEAEEQEMVTLTEGPQMVKEPTTSIDSLQEKELIEESELFLQTIAELEEQKEKQAEEVEAENERVAEAKRAKAQERDSLFSVTDSLMVNGAENALLDTTNDQVEPLVVDGEADLEQESLALKSNADPNEYLKALAQMEAEMAVDDSQNKKKYQLQDLGQTEIGKEDPMLQEIIAEDRKALEEHQKVAAQKEAELREQMQKDRALVDGKEELLVTDDVDLPVVSKGKLKKRLSEKTDLESQIALEDTVVDGQLAVEEEIIADVNVLEEPVESEVQTEQHSEERVEEQLQEQNESLESEELVDEPVEAVETESQLGETVSEIEATEKDEEVLVSEQDIAAVATAEVSQLEEAPKEVESKSETVEGSEEQVVIEEVATESAEPAVTVVVDESQKVEEIQPEQPTKKPADLVAEEETVQGNKANRSVVGRIPFMEPALRDYSKREADFSGIEDKSIKRMVQRMRAEDIGRIAVIKNMRNEWVRAGKTQAALEEIKNNERNQNVLAQFAERPSREEKVREPFNTNDLKAREDVFYKLEFNLVANPVSERVSSAMAPEHVITFAMPEFELSSGHFRTLADVRAEKRFYESRGFNEVRIQPYLNGEPTGLSVVENVPFVD